MSSRNLIGNVENIQKYKDPTNSKKHIWDITITDEETGNLEKIRLQGCDPPTPDQGDISRGDKIEAFVSGQEGGFHSAVKINDWRINKTIQFKPCKEAGGGGGLPIKPIAIGAVAVLIIAGLAFSGIFEAENKPPVVKIEAPIINKDGYFAIPKGYSYEYKSGSSDPDGKITKINWQFSDGYSSTSGTVRHALNNLGLGSVKLTVWDDDNAKTEKVVPISVYEPIFRVPNDKFVNDFALAINNDPLVMSKLKSDSMVLSNENSPIYKEFYTSNEIIALTEKYDLRIPIYDDIIVREATTREFTSIEPLWNTQRSYEGDCSSRPPKSVCLTYDDGYIWLVYDAISEWEQITEDGNDVQIAVGFKMNYYHMLDTSLVKTLPK